MIVILIATPITQSVTSYDTYYNVISQTDARDNTTFFSYFRL